MVTTAEVSRKKRRSWAWAAALGLAGVIAVIWIIWAAVGKDEVADVGVTIENIVDNPTAYVGRTVTVAGNIDQRYGADVFTIKDEKRGFDNQLLVVSATRGLAPSGNANVQITGEVRQFAVYEFERDYGIDFDETAVVGWVGQPVLVARSIQVRKPS